MTYYNREVRRVRVILIVSFLAVCTAGPLAHFAYDFLGKNRIIGYVTPVNESTWEHMKIIFFPMLIACCVIHFLVKDIVQNSLGILLTGLLLATFSMPIIFYTYKGILGFENKYINMGIFFISTMIGFFYIVKRFYRDADRADYVRILTNVCLILLACSFFATFVIFTYNPPELGIFANPLV